MSLPQPGLPDVMLILCERNDRGEGFPCQQGRCSTWFSSLERYNDWVRAHPLNEPYQYYSLPLETRTEQLKYAKMLQGDRFIGVICDPKESGSAVVPIGDLIVAIEARLAEPA